MALHVRSADMQMGENYLQPVSGSSSTYYVYGMGGALVVVTREGGYHSTPHRHDAEQLNYITAGSIWVFIEDQRFLAATGDFYRVPANAVHWGWNVAAEPVSSVQAFVPAVGPYTKRGSVCLLDEHEDEAAVSSVTSERIADPTPYLDLERQWYEAQVAEDPDFRAVGHSE